MSLKEMAIKGSKLYNNRVLMYLIKRLLKNDILNEQIKQTSLIDVTLQNLPGKNSSIHNNKITDTPVNIYNIIKLYFRIFYFIIKYCFKKNKKIKNSNQEYNFLVFVPNNKFIDNLNVVKSGVKNFKTISISNIDEKDYINIKEILPNRFYVVFSFSIILLIYPLTIIGKKAEMKNLINNIVLVQKLIINILILNELFKKIHFKNYFSLLPNIDHHYIIETYFNSKFVHTFAIRTTATAASDEHRYIKTKTLFYKSETEKKIYENLLIDKNIELKPASLLLNIIENKENRSSINRTINIVFIDTCLTKYDIFTKGREYAIKDFYDTIKKYDNITVYHKFHPGLEKEARIETTQKISSYAIILNDSDQSFINKADLIIGFYSTVFQIPILKQTPIIMITHDYSFIDSGLMFKDYDLEFSPAIKTTNNKELNSILDNILTAREKIHETLKTNELYIWYKEYYNFPNGLTEMFEVLNR